MGLRSINDGEDKLCNNELNKDNIGVNGSDQQSAEKLIRACLLDKNFLIFSILYATNELFFHCIPYVLAVTISHFLLSFR